MVLLLKALTLKVIPKCYVRDLVPCDTLEEVRGGADEGATTHTRHAVHTLATLDVVHVRLGDPYLHGEIRQTMRHTAAAVAGCCACCEIQQARLVAIPFDALREHALGILVVEGHTST